MSITPGYYRRLFDIIVEELDMERFADLYDPEIYGFNREQKRAILIQQIIMHSMYDQDIQNRYRSILDTTQGVDAATHYIRSAKIEYAKLMNYIYHITNKTSRTHLFVVEYPTENSPNPVRVAASLAATSAYKIELNKHIVSEIKRIQEQIKETQKKIETIKQIMSNFIDPKDNYQPDNFTSVFLPQKLVSINLYSGLDRDIPDSGQPRIEVNCSPNEVDLPRYESSANESNGYKSFCIDTMIIMENNINVVQEGIRFLENKINCLKKMKEDYTIFDTLNIDLIKNETCLRKYRLKYALYLKTVKLDTTHINKLPEDTVKIIREYIGEDYLNKIRYHCMYKKYFPHGREDINNTLKSWKKEDLMNYGKQTFLRYNINTENRYYRFRKIWLVRSWTKDKIIDHITRNAMLYTFPDFQRDVYIITNLLKEKRNKNRKKKQQPTLGEENTPQATTLTEAEPTLHANLII
jgi:hypothetical protein